MALTILGALLSREYPRTGFFVTLFVMLFYLSVGLRRTMSCIRNFRQVDSRHRLRAVLALAMVLVLLNAILGRGIPYFLMLLVLAVDYWISQRRSSAQGES